jgi:Flp pilus assembly protein TadD
VGLESVLERRGRYAECESLLTESLAIRRQWLGPEHPLTATVLTNLGVLRYRMGDLEAAEKAIRESLPVWRRTLGGEHPNTVAAMDALAAVLREEGRYDESELLMRQALSLPIVGGRARRSRCSGSRSTSRGPLTMVGTPGWRKLRRRSERA